MSLEEEVEKLRHELAIHHTYYQCVPRRVVRVQLEDLEDRLRSMREAIARYLKNKNLSSLESALTRELERCPQ